MMEALSERTPYGPTTANIRRETAGPGLEPFHRKVAEISRYGSIVRVRVSIGKNRLLAELPSSALDELSLEEGKDVHVVIKLRRLRYVES
jgi:ABC-type molybdate transport system ATPase subunit